MASKKEYVSENSRLMKEWNWEKNVEFNPEKLASGSREKVWWKCDKGHEWQATISNRSYGTGCPYCANKKVLKGYNDLQTVNSNLAKEWNYEKNNELTPENITPNSNKKVWWKCNKGHEWTSTVYHRNNGRGCPICNSERKTSFPEYALVFYLKKYSLEVIHSYKEKGYELDVYIPSKKVAIEYDGGIWHKNRTNHDLDKNRKCEKDGIKLYRIREGLPSLNDSSIDFVVTEGQKDLSDVLKKVLSEITEVNIDVDLERDLIDIDNLREFAEKKNSLLLSNPKIAKEWNYEKNGNLKPENFTASSNKKVWWKCRKGHEWQAVINSRNKGHECPYCSGKYAIKDESDLQTLNPLLAKEWNFEKNNELTPIDVSPNSNKKVWWKCSKGHEWQTSIYHRNQGCGCPYCSGKKVLSGYNDLQTVNPLLAKQWNYNKNNGLTPSGITSGSDKKVWWECNKGHEWQASISSRSSGKGCPICAGQKILAGYNDLQTINPSLAKDWNFEKNNGLKPTDVLPNSNKKAWWKCNKGHEWQAVIASRNNGNGCPYCGGKKVLIGYNDLKTANPTLAKDWNYEKNGDLKPENFTVSSNEKVWWKCNNGHEWQISINTRKRGNGCPYCAGQKVIQGINDLQTLNPILAREWDFEKNGELTPTDLMPNSNKKVWWKCSEGHEWQAMISSRNKGHGCQKCYITSRKSKNSR